MGAKAVARDGSAVVKESVGGVLHGEDSDAVTPLMRPT